MPDDTQKLEPYSRQNGKSLKVAGVGFTHDHENETDPRR